MGWTEAELLCIYSNDCDDTPCIESWLVFFWGVADHLFRGVVL